MVYVLGKKPIGMISILSRYFKVYLSPTTLRKHQLHPSVPKTPDARRWFDWSSDMLPAE